MTSKGSSIDEIASLRATVDNLNARIAELTEAVQARDTFIAVAAHELRNPMTPMIGHVELLLSWVKAGKILPEQVEQRLDRTPARDEPLREAGRDPSRRLPSDQRPVHA